MEKIVDVFWNLVIGLFLVVLTRFLWYLGSIFKVTKKQSAAAAAPAVQKEKWTKRTWEWLKKTGLDSVALTKRLLKATKSAVKKSWEWLKKTGHLLKKNKKVCIVSGLIVVLIISLWSLWFGYHKLLGFTVPKITPPDSIMGLGWFKTILLAGIGIISLAILVLSIVWWKMSKTTPIDINKEQKSESSKILPWIKKRLKLILAFIFVVGFVIFWKSFLSENSENLSKLEPLAQIIRENRIFFATVAVLILIWLARKKLPSLIQSITTLKKVVAIGVFGSLAFFLFSMGKWVEHLASEHPCPFTQPNAKAEAEERAYRSDRDTQKPNMINGAAEKIYSIPPGQSSDWIPCQEGWVTEIKVSGSILVQKGKIIGRSVTPIDYPPFVDNPGKIWVMSFGEAYRYMNNLATTNIVVMASIRPK